VTYLQGKKLRISKAPDPTLPLAPVTPKIKGLMSFKIFSFYKFFPAFYKSIKASCKLKYL
jgi:hypothetical protein